MPRPQPPAAVLLLLLAAAACGGGGDGGAGRRPDPVPVSGGEAEALAWEECGEVECATLAVPLDGRRPRGEAIDLVLARRPADGEAVGSLLVNPGGPGVSGTALVHEADVIFPDEVLDRFDVVGWDPRGVGDSTAVDCVDELDAFWAVDRSPDDAAEVRENVEESQSLADACARSDGRLLPHVSSSDTVDDMDRIRDALGEEQLTFLGFSYGTYLGAKYAERYPRRVRALVLDGAVDPALTPEEATRQQAIGFDRALDAFFDDCAADDGCAFHAGGDPAGAFDRLMGMIDAEPLPALSAVEEDRTLGPGEADIGVAAALYFGRAGWPILADALNAAARGDGGPLLELSDSYTARGADGTYSDQTEAFYAIGCLDGPRPPGPEDTAAWAEDLARDAPHFGPTTAWLGLPCAYWPVDPTARPARVRAPGAATALVLGTSGDPATPLAWAESLAGQLGARLVVLDEDGHTAFARGSDCVDEIVVDYLVDLDLPEDGTTCDA